MNEYLCLQSAFSFFFHLSEILLMKFYLEKSVEFHHDDDYDDIYYQH